MWFMVDKGRKFAIGWSAKCGCTHLKRIWLHMRTGQDIQTNVHKYIPFARLPRDTRGYTILIVGRNPYDRLVSGFLDKYSKPGKFRNMWPKQVPLTFERFVHVLAHSDWNTVERHHFAPQTQDGFNITALQQARRVVVNDLNSIDYKLIEQAFHKRIPPDMITWRGSHVRPTQNITNCSRASIRPIDQLDKATLDAADLYTSQLQQLVAHTFRHDLAFFAKHGIRYRPLQPLGIRE
jgi:hypothetical protein